MGADCFLVATNPAEMGIGAQCDDTAAFRTAIALEVKAGGKALKVSGSEAVAMELPVAAQTVCRSWPWIIFALLKNVLEKNGNKTYHENHIVVWG